MTPPTVFTIADTLGMSHGGFFIVLALVIIWSLYWKGRALWMAAQRSDKVWFVILLVLNTLGVLDLVYVCFLAKPGDPEYDGVETEKNIQS